MGASTDPRYDEKVREELTKEIVWVCETLFSMAVEAFAKEDKKKWWEFWKD